MARQIYSLGHDFFDSLCPEVVRGLINDEIFSDVTLISGDGVSIKAHRNIVASFSETLKTVFVENTSKNYLSVYLMDIDGNILRNLKNFIYVGEAEVPSESLDIFLKAGTKLKIKGLTQQDDSLQNVETDT